MPSSRTRRPACSTTDSGPAVAVTAGPRREGGQGGVAGRGERGEVRVPPGVAEGERLSGREGSREVVGVRVLAAPADYAVVRYVALLGLVVAFVFLWLLLR